MDDGRAFVMRERKRDTSPAGERENPRRERARGYLLLAPGLPGGMAPVAQGAPRFQTSSYLRYDDQPPREKRLIIKYIVAREREIVNISPGDRLHV